MSAHDHGVRTSRDHLVELAMDEIPGGTIMVFDTELRFLVTRGSALAKHGMRAENLEGRLVSEALAPARWAFYRPRFEAALAGRDTAIQVMSVDGTAVYQVRTAPLRDTEGRILGGVAISTDVSESVAANRRLAESEAQFRMLAENASDVVLRTNAAGIIDWVSPSTARVLGWTPQDLLGHITLEFIHPDDLAEVTRARASVYAGGVVNRHLARFRRSDGQYRWASVSGHPVPGDDGELESVVISIRDVHDETLARHAVAASERLFRTAMDASLVGMALTGLDGTFWVVNPALCRLLDRTEDWLLAHGADDVIHPEDLDRVRAVRAELATGAVGERVTEMRMLRADGAVLWTRRSGALIRAEDGTPDCLVLQWEDLTAEHHAQERLAYQAFHDPLTGLRNRAWMLDMLEGQLQAGDRETGSLGLLFIDLDDFKVVNDSLGHAVGDEVLCAVARRILRSLRPNDHAGRFGGDEFVVAVAGVSDRGQLDHVADRISRAVSEELLVAGHRVVPTVSMGIAIASPGMRPADLLRNTDAALYRAKAEGRKCWRFFDESMHARALSRLTMEEELRAAIAQGQFLVLFQPIVALADARVVGYEALVRWQHPCRGQLVPREFLAIAESAGLLVEIGDVVLHAVCRELSARPWLAAPVSINLGASQLARPGWASRMLSVLAEHGVSPSRITVDVAESDLLGLPEPARDELASLAAHGVGIQVDDFGTGMSSVRALRQLPLTGLKLDPSYVVDLGAEDRGAARTLVTGLARLVVGLDLLGIAEGIETPAQAAALAEEGWLYGQGYLFGRPGPLPDAPSYS